MIQKREVILKYGEKKVIANLLGVTEKTVYNAVTFRCNTELAKRIRRLAVMRGGMCNAPID